MYVLKIYFRKTKQISHFDFEKEEVVLRFIEQVKEKFGDDVLCSLMKIKNFTHGYKL